MRSYYKNSPFFVENLVAILIGLVTVLILGGTIYSVIAAGIADDDARQACLNSGFRVVSSCQQKWRCDTDFDGNSQCAWKEECYWECHGPDFAENPNQ